MRDGSVLVVALAFCAASCSNGKEPSPNRSDSALSDAPAPAASLPPQTPTPSPPSAAAAPVIPAKLRALGTEPFWNAEIDGLSLVYTTPEDQTGQRAPLSRRDTAIGAEFSGELASSAVHLEITRRSCSDGMSDRTYRFTAVLTIDSERREGCAS